MNDNDNTQEQKFDAVIKIRKINSYQMSPTHTYLKESDTHIVYKKKNLPVRHDDNDTTDSIISYLTKHPNSKAIDIANYLKVTRKEVNSILYRLRKEGRCEVNLRFEWWLTHQSSSSCIKGNNEISQREVAQIPSLPRPKFLNRRGAALFRLSYPNGNVEESDDFLATYVNFIKYVGPERIEKMNIYSLGKNLVIRENEIPTEYKNMFKEVGNGYFFNAISTTHRKYEVMSFITEQLNLGIKVELVEKVLSKHPILKEENSLYTSQKVSPTHIAQQKMHNDEDLQNSLIDYITRFPNSRVSDIANYLKVTHKEVNSILYRLQKMGRCKINPYFQWSIVEVSSNSSVKEPAQECNCKDCTSKYIDTLAYSRIFSMKYSNKDGYKAPHKAIYLLSIIDCIELKHIVERRFHITKFLMHQFEVNWKKYASHLVCFSPTIWNPIFYMEDSIIHKVWNPGVAMVQPRNLSRCHVVFNYLEIASDLWKVLQDKQETQCIKTKLIETYISTYKKPLSLNETKNETHKINKDATYWILPGNTNIFRVTDYFNEHDVVDWKQSHYKFKIGDIVFLYVSSPTSSIRYMLEVIKCDIPYDESINDEEYWTKNHEMTVNMRDYKYVRLRLLKTSDNPKLHLYTLSKYGMSAPQGAMRNLPKALVDYIKSQFFLSSIPK